jgi:undecaprenyl-diphosphatase
MLDYVYALILGIVQGLTEFLPISSTGHLLIASALFRFPTPELGVPDTKAFADTFAIFIQIGTVFSVLVFYARDLLTQARQITRDRATQRFWLYVLLAFFPAAAIGFVLRDWIQGVLYSPVVIAAALIGGGLIFLLIEARPRTPVVRDTGQMRLWHAIAIGVAQVMALIPGMSRSGASIVGGLLAGLDRVTATKFSFYLALPTLGAATVYQLFTALRDGHVVAAQLPILFLGAFVAFLVGWASIAWLLRFVANNSFRLFGYYRIAVGLIILGLTLFTTALAN